MAESFTKVLLSGSTNGRPIPVAATSSPGTTIHTAVNSATQLDEVWIYAYNIHSSEVTLTVEKGGTDASDQLIKEIPANSGPYPVLPGTLLNNNLVIKAFASIANKINLDGFINRIDQT